MHIVCHPQPPRDEGGAEFSECRLPKGDVGRRAFTPFLLGQIYITPGVGEALSGADITTALARHARGDWGELDEQDRLANDQSLQDGTRILSAYHSSTGEKFWIITEADRSSTTLLLPQEY